MKKKNRKGSKLQEPQYPQTPRLNCMYCKWYNQPYNACTSPKSGMIEVFHPIMDKDCIIFTYERSENPVAPEKEFAAKYCIGKTCPYYYASKRLCTRPSLCPYKGEETEENTIFTNIKFKDD